MPTNYAGTILPQDATPVFGTNTTDVTDTTAQQILAGSDLGSTSQAYYITEITVTNKTAAESPVIKVQDDEATPVVLDTFVVGGLASVHRKYDPPRQATAGADVDAVALSAVGDCLVTVSGYYGTPGLNTY